MLRSVWIRDGGSGAERGPVAVPFTPGIISLISGASTHWRYESLCMSAACYVLPRRGGGSCCVNETLWSRNKLQNISYSLGREHAVLSAKLYGLEGGIWSAGHQGAPKCRVRM